MKKWMVCVSVMVALCFVAGSLLAAEGGDKPKTEKPKSEKLSQAMGVVKSYSTETKELLVTVKREGTTTEMTFLTTEETKVVAGREGAETKALTDLAEGTRVRVTYKKAEGEGKPTATRIMILPSEKPKEKKAE